VGAEAASDAGTPRLGTSPPDRYPHPPRNIRNPFPLADFILRIQWAFAGQRLVLVAKLRRGDIRFRGFTDAGDGSFSLRFVLTFRINESNSVDS